jgi:hypothetical protein
VIPGFHCLRLSNCEPSPLSAFDNVFDRRSYDRAKEWARPQDSFGKCQQIAMKKINVSPANEFADKKDEKSGEGTTVRNDFLVVVSTDYLDSIPT